LSPSHLLCLLLPLCNHFCCVTAIHAVHIFTLPLPILFFLSPLLSCPLLGSLLICMLSIPLCISYASHALICAAVAFIFGSESGNFIMLPSFSTPSSGRKKEMLASGHCKSTMVNYLNTAHEKGKMKNEKHKHKQKENGQMKNLLANDRFLLVILGRKWGSGMVNVMS
jgi:hypothetical protein